MWARTWGALVTMGLLACGGGERQAEQTQQQQPPAAGGDTGQTAAAAGSGQTVEVRMTGNARDRAAYEPSQLTISPGTTVRFINVSGGPHNIAFWGDSIPSGAEDPLNSALANRMGDLTGPLVIQPSGTYDVVFPAGAPTGVYKGYCTPHVAMGMNIAITVQ
jgi:plastocyanin